MGFILKKLSEIEAIIWFIEGHKDNLISSDKGRFRVFSRNWGNLKTCQEISIFLKSNRIFRLSQKAQLALSMWIDGQWPILLSLKIPSPQEMLEIQAQGKRIVSWLPHIKGPILGKKNNWEFMLHDLMHAERFFYSPELYKAQVGFFRWLEKQAFEISGPEWDYLRSDMNTHPLHALQFLKHLLNCKEIYTDFNVPHWDIINSQEFSHLPISYTEDINSYFKSYSG